MRTSFSIIAHRNFHVFAYLAFVLVGSMEVLFGFAVAEESTVAVLEVIVKVGLFVVEHENDKPI